MVSKINLYIDELLLQNDCVVIPNFGGFIANYLPARYEASTSLFFPPTKLVLFNKNLVSNDGLLCGYLANKENISFSAATSKVENLVYLVKQSLDSGFQVEVKNMGILFLDNENNIQFKITSTANFLLESFGLPSFYMPTYSKLESKSEVKFVNRPAIPAKKKHQNRIKKYWPVFVFIPLAISFVVVQNKTNFLNRLNVSTASWNPFSTKSMTIDTNDLSSIPQPENSSKTLGVKPEVIKQQEVALNSMLPKKNTETQLETTAQEQNKFNFYIVAGCFKSENNAEKLIQQLQSKNYKASIVGKNKDGLYRVAINKFATKEQADLELVQVKNTIESAWILSM